MLSVFDVFDLDVAPSPVVAFLGPKETKLSHPYRERARPVGWMWKSSKVNLLAGQRLAAAIG
jgi:hypothetical protein